MKIAAFEFADGARFQSGAHPDANVVGAHIELLRKKFKGELTPKDVVDDARGHNSPLHSFFEWDEGAAAEAYRLGQARGLIRAVVAVYTSPDKAAVRTRAYVHIPEHGAEHYREVGHAMSQAKTRALVLQRALSEFQQWRKRYQDLKELSELFAIADEIVKKLPKVAKASKAA